MNSYDHHAAIYLLLLERLRTRSASQESNVCLASSQLGSNGPQVSSSKHPSDQQRRRPSTIAEQAMRKLGISNSYGRTESPPSRQHSLLSNNDRPMEPIPSMIQLRDTSIREQTPLPLSSANQHVRGNENYFRGSAAHMGMQRFERDGNGSPYRRENSCLLSRDNCALPIGAYRTPSNRLLSSGIDQRIMKQSTEDCRRLLQQATAVADPNRTPNTPMELSSTPPTQQQSTPQQHNISSLAAPSYRVLTTSNSFDSKSNVPNIHGRFFMSPEATKLFNTLQQSPLPINSEVRQTETF